MTLFRLLLPSVLAALLVVIFIHVRPFDAGKSHAFEVHLTTEQAGRARLFWDDGRGFSEHHRIGHAIEAGTHRYRLPLPHGPLRALRFWPLDREGTVILHEAAIVSPRGEAIHRFHASSLAAAPDDPSAGVTHRGIVLQATPGEGLDFKLATPLELRWTRTPDLRAMGLDFAMYAAGILAVLLLIQLLPIGWRNGARRPVRSLGNGLARWPRSTLFLASAAAVALSSFPVVFCGKSFVSPGNGALLLYDDVPTIPGAPADLPEAPQGSDIGALMWTHVPNSVVQHEAIFQHGELPIWNRYNYAGTPLLGQGLSMLGDPLQWLPIATRGASWAWDVKFLVAKGLFALGVGLCVRALIGGIGTAALLAISCAFLGFFSYRFNHPAFFALCYSPWILLAWIRASSTTGRLWPWIIAVALANVWQLNSGVVKESIALVASLNFTGLLLVLLQPTRDRVRRGLAMLWGVALFALLSAPFWGPFVETLKESWSTYEAARAFQIQPGVLIGLFDDLFYRQLVPGEAHFNPSANFLVLLGLLWAVANLRELLGNAGFLAIALGAVPSALLAFGVVPPALIEKLPFLAHVHHVDNTFSVVLLIHLLLLAGFGLRALWENALAPRMAADSVVALGVLAALLALYLGFAQAVHRTGTTIWEAGAGPRFSGFFVLYAVILIIGVIGMPWVVRSLRRRPSLGALLIGALLLFGLHFRHAMWLGTPFDRYVMNPGARTNLAASSPSLEKIREDIAESGEPARIAGFKDVLVPGWQALYGFEHFAGPEPLINILQRDLAEGTGATPQWGWRWRLGVEGNHARILRLCDLWGVRYLLAMPADVKPGASAVVDDLAVTENPNAWPRAYFASRTTPYHSVSSFLALLDESEGRPFAAVPSTEVLAEESEPAEIVPAKNYRLTPNTTAFDIVAPAAGVVVLSESFEGDNWRVTLDGTAVNYFRVNHAFLGVNVAEAGTYTLRFEYWPRNLKRYLWLGASGLLLVFLTPLFARWLRRERAPATVN